MTQALAATLNEICDAQPFYSGWYFKDLRTGEEADRNGDVVTPSASTRKIAIMMTALKAVHEGKLALDQPVTIEAKYQISDSGTFQHFAPGFTITLQDVLVMMIIVSDNTCTGTIADMVGLDAINAFSQSIGMKGTTHRQGIPTAQRQGTAIDNLNVTTPSDVGHLLDLIQQGVNDPDAAAQLGCTTELCSLAIDILSWQKLTARMPALLPVGTTVAHKTGTAGPVRNDAGIVFRDGEPRYILTVYTDNIPDDMPDGLPGAAAATQLIAQLTRACWDALP